MNLKAHLGGWAVHINHGGVKLSPATIGNESESVWLGRTWEIACM